MAYLDQSNNLPFDVKRVYWLNQVPDQQNRGGHAHRSSLQLIICLQGEIHIELESQSGEKHFFLLTQPDQGLFIPPLWWGEMKFKQNAIMIGLASDDFSEGDYIRNRADF